MKRTALAMGLALVVAPGLPNAAAQTGAPVQQKAAQTATKPTAEKAGKEAAGEGKLQLKDLPPAVKATVEAETKNATVKGLSKEKEKGKTVYELESLVNGRTRDLMIDSAGKVYVVEEQVDPNSAPVAVKTALEAKGTIILLESVVENGTTTYEGQVKTKTGKKIAMELNADGTTVRK